MMFTQLFAWMLAEGSSNKGVPWWVFVIFIVILLIILWFWFGREEEEVLSDTKGSTEVPVDSLALKTDILPVDEAVITEAAIVPDDLKKIEGIGPKVSSLLNQAGIMTFQQVVDAGAEKLEEILDAASLQMIDADTWPEQAKLAAAGNWEGLKALQDKLKGGKRV